MKPEPFAWTYQNANTEHQYLVWHKQEGGRNWMPLFTFQYVQEAIFAEREACERSASVALLGADKSLSDRVLNAIRARGEE